MTNLKDYDILLSRLPKEDAERTMNAIIKNYVAEVHKRAILSYILSAIRADIS